MNKKIKIYGIDSRVKL